MEITSSTNSSLINAVLRTKTYTEEKPEDFGDWCRKEGFILSMQRPEMFAAKDGQARPTEERVKRKRNTGGASDISLVHRC